MSEFLVTVWYGEPGSERGETVLPTLMVIAETAERAVQLFHERIGADARAPLYEHRRLVDADGTVQMIYYRVGDPRRGMKPSYYEVTTSEGFDQEWLETIRRKCWREE